MGKGKGKGKGQGREGSTASRRFTIMRSLWMDPLQKTSTFNFTVTWVGGVPKKGKKGGRERRKKRRMHWPIDRSMDGLMKDKKGRKERRKETSGPSSRIVR
jgi:hypothetical protein